MTDGVRLVEAGEISAVPEPLYLQLYRAIQQAIRGGRLKSGDRLPSERTFSDQFGVSRATVRRALGKLTEEGFVEATVGRGSFFVGGPLAEPPNVLMSFTELAAMRGLTSSARVLQQCLRPASPEEAALFGINLQELMFDLERLRLLDAVPTAVDRIRVPVAIASGIAEVDFADASIYAALEVADAAPVRADVVVSAAAADDTRADALCIAVGAPLIVCTAMSYDTRGRLVEIGAISYRADRYQFRAVLTREAQETISNIGR